jgi:hypothetical protein
MSGRLNWTSDYRECGVRTDGSAYLGRPGTLICVKPEGHRSSHASEEGAMWYEPAPGVERKAS